MTVTKTPSTPEAPERGVVDGLAVSAAEPATVETFAHGTTVATNAVLERDWTETALVTTEGFRDVLEFGRQVRPELYDLSATKSKPVVEWDARFEVDERGRVEQPLTDAAVERVVGAGDEVVNPLFDGTVHLIRARGGLFEGDRRVTAAGRRPASANQFRSDHGSPHLRRLREPGSRIYRRGSRIGLTMPSSRLSNCV